MVEGAPLLREYTRKGIEGSNPFLSATYPNPPSNVLTLTDSYGKSGR